MREFFENREAEKARRHQQQIDLDCIAAIDRSEELRGSRLFSAPSEEGLLAIHVAGRTRNFLSSRGVLERDQRLEYAEQLAEERERSGKYGAVAIRANTSYELIKADQQDPTVSDIITIAPGSIGVAQLSAREKFTWIDAAKDLDHLKRGAWEEHAFGNVEYPSTVALPLGVCAVSNLANIQMYIGLRHSDMSPDYKTPIRPSFSSDFNLVDQLSMFSHMAADLRTLYS